MKITVWSHIDVKEVRTPELRLYKSTSYYGGEYKKTKPIKTTMLYFAEVI
jgi:hypothetical protein